jgi:bacteriocin-like protein
MKKLSEITNFKGLSIKELFQIKGGAVAADSGICNVTVCQSSVCRIKSSNTSCTTGQCVTRVNATNNASA